MRSHLSLTALAAIAALALSACERRLTNANLSCVKPEMTTKEVESILGSPTLVEATPEAAAALTPAPLDSNAAEATRQAAQAAGQATQGRSTAGTSSKDNTVVRYIYQQKDKTVALTFVGNRLAPNGISGLFE